MFEGLFSVEGGAAVTEVLFDRGATAIACASYLMALGDVRAARSQGMHAPDDLSVVGFDDSVLVGYLDPPLTTVRQPVAAIGGAAVTALTEAIEGQPVPAHEYVFAPELVLRSSTGRAPDRE